MKCLVTGAGGFIGGHLARDLAMKGHEVVGVDIKPQKDWFIRFPEVRGIDQLDLRREHNARWVMLGGYDRVYNLAADMGGMGFIENNKAACMLSVLINTNLLEAAKGQSGLGRYFFSSSACVYASDKQTKPDVTALKEADAYPADPEDGYGWEKLFSERMCRHFREDYGVPTRVARFHNVFGPRTSYSGGREKAPAAICRKIIEAKLTGNHEVEIWGDGEQTRSFMYIDDCIYGIHLITESNLEEPINLGSHELVSINQLVDMAEEIAGIKVKRTYDLDAPKGVRGRNSDNTLMQDKFGWEPHTRLRDGLEKTYAWIYQEMTNVHSVTTR